MSRAVARLVLAAVAVVFVAAGVTSAQTTTETKKFEVIAVHGNDLVVKLPEGTKELTVPEDFRFTVDGQQLSVHDLKPGMKGTAVVTTKTTLHPVTVTEVKNGTVRQVSGPTIIVQTAEGYKMFTRGGRGQAGSQDHAQRRAGAAVRLQGRRQAVGDDHHQMPPRVVTEKEVSAIAGPRRGGAAAPAKAHTAAAAAARRRRRPRSAGGVGRSSCPRRRARCRSSVSSG